MSALSHIHTPDRRGTALAAEDRAGIHITTKVFMKQPCDSQTLEVREALSQRSPVLRRLVQGEELFSPYRATGHEASHKVDELATLKVTSFCELRKATSEWLTLKMISCGTILNEYRSHTTGRDAPVSTDPPGLSECLGAHLLWHVQ